MNNASLEKLISQACRDIASEAAARFDEVDVTDITVSAETEKRFSKMLDRAFFKESRTFWIVKKIVVAVAVILALLCIVVAAVEPLRNRLWKFKEQPSANCVKIKLETKAGEDIEYPKIIPEVKKPKIKDGWKIMPANPDYENPLAFIITLDDGKMIYYSMSTVHGELYADNSKHTVEEAVLSNGQKAVVIDYEHGYCMVLWQDEYRYDLSSHDVGKEVLLELAGTVE